VEIAVGWRIIGEEAKSRQGRETRRVVDSRTCNRFCPITGTFSKATNPYGSIAADVKREKN
jgi:hypothetical protein